MYVVMQSEVREDEENRTTWDESFYFKGTQINFVLSVCLLAGILRSSQVLSQLLLSRLLFGSVTRIIGVIVDIECLSGRWM